MSLERFVAMLENELVMDEDGYAYFLIEEDGKKKRVENFHIFIEGKTFKAEDIRLEIKTLLNQNTIKEVAWYLYDDKPVQRLTRKFVTENKVIYRCVDHVSNTSFNDFINMVGKLEDLLEENNIRDIEELKTKLMRFNNVIQEYETLLSSTKIGDDIWITSKTKGLMKFKRIKLSKSEEKK